MTKGSKRKKRYENGGMASTSSNARVRVPFSGKANPSKAKKARFMGTKHEGKK